LPLSQATHVCLRWVRAKDIYAAIAEHHRSRTYVARHRHGGAAQCEPEDGALFAPSEFRHCRSATAGSHTARHDDAGSTSPTFTD
jgi:hypothetical protein